MMKGVYVPEKGCKISLVTLDDFHYDPTNKKRARIKDTFLLFKEANAPCIMLGRDKCHNL